MLWVILKMKNKLAKNVFLDASHVNNRLITVPSVMELIEIWKIVAGKL